jgi:hypothetical protein
MSGSTVSNKLINKRMAMKVAEIKSRAVAHIRMCWDDIFPCNAEAKGGVATSNLVCFVQ